jgi:uncharacterized protein YxjI
MNFPLELRFKILALASQISVTDARGQVICYVKQKMFKLKEAVTVFSDESQKTPLFRIAADRIIDISAQYRIEDDTGKELGVLQRRGMRSFWRAHYEVHQAGKLAFTLREENAWVKVADHFLGQLPIVGILTGYLFHPAYLLTRGGESGDVVLRVEKRPAFFEGVYRIEQKGSASDEEQRLGLLAILMMALLERQRG